MGLQDPLFYYVGSSRVYVERIPGEFLIGLAYTAGDVETSLRTRTDALEPPALEAPTTSLSKVPLLPEKSPYRIVRGAAPRVRHNAPDGQRTLTPGVSAVAWFTPVVRPAGSTGKMYPLNRILVRFRDSIDEREIRDLLSRYPVHDTRTPSRRSKRLVLEVTGAEADSVFRIANALHEHPSTLYATPDFFVPDRPAAIEDPYYPEQWHLHNTGGSHLLNAGADINAPAAWALSLYESDWESWQGAIGTRGVAIAVLDDAIDTTHPDLAPNYIGGRDFDRWPDIDDDPSPDRADDPATTATDESQPHGTACAGLAVAAANGVGVRGSAPGCSLLGIKRRAASFAGIAAAFEWATERNADVLSNSWVRQANSDLIDAIAYAAASGREGKGTPIVFAAGNSFGAIGDESFIDQNGNGVWDPAEPLLDANGNGVWDPANNPYAALDDVICVGAISSLNLHADYSNFGPEMDMAAPSRYAWETAQRGVLITTTDLVDDVYPADGYNDGSNSTQHPDTSYTNGFGGTSAAAPQVAGVAGLVLSANPDLTAREVKAALYRTAARVEDERYPYGDRSYFEHFGHGRLNAYRAVRRALFRHYTTGRLRLRNVATFESDGAPRSIPAGEGVAIPELRLDGTTQADIDRVLGAWLVLDVENVADGTTLSIFDDTGRLVSHCPPTGEGYRRPVIFSIPPGTVPFEIGSSGFVLQRDEPTGGEVRLHTASLRLLYVKAGSEFDSRVTGGVRIPPESESGPTLSWVWDYPTSAPRRGVFGRPVIEFVDTAAFSIEEIKAARIWVTGRAIGHGEVAMRVNGASLGTLPMVTNDDASVRTRYLTVSDDRLAAFRRNAANRLELLGDDFHVYSWGLTFDAIAGTSSGTDTWNAYQ